MTPMHTILTLPPQEARKIAAGQVVDRPANVVKELVENALDAGATHISVTVHDAGQSLIRVVDNGHGMSDADALKCFEHHATSKIRSFDDVAHLHTYGFRGEALASIAAVSTITLLTNSNEQAQGIKVIGSGHEGFIATPTTCTRGTDISVHDLFFNVPVRKKFLKKDETELRAITSLMHAFALTHTQVHFQLSTHHALIMNCPRTKTLSSRVAQVFDHTMAEHLIELQADTTEAIAITGLISNQQLTRYNRNHLFFFVNKRWVKNYHLGQAILKGYAPTLQQGRFPVALLFVEIPPQDVDINIHPRKEEVAFLHPHRIEKAVAQAVQKTLAAHVTNTLDDARKPSSIMQTTHRPQLLQPSFFSSNSVNKHAALVFPTSAQLARAHHEPRKEATSTVAHPGQEKQLPLPTQPSFDNAHVKDEQTVYTTIGIFHNTYIMIEQTDGILMIDQHAAHERILYEQFSNPKHAHEATQLLFPETISFSPEHYDLLAAHLSFFADHGIRLEPFGTHCLIVQATPVPLKMISWREFFKEIIQLINEESLHDTQKQIENLTHKLRATMACKAAIKAGDSLSELQTQKLLHDLHRCEQAYSCPHGRPTTWLLPLSDIEKKFKRRM